MREFLSCVHSLSPVSTISFGAYRTDSSARVTVSSFPHPPPSLFPLQAILKTVVHKARPTISSRRLADQVSSIAQALSVEARWSGYRRNGRQRRFSQPREKCQWSPVASEPGHQGEKSPSCDWPLFATEEGLGLGILWLCSACLMSSLVHTHTPTPIYLYT